MKGKIYKSDKEIIKRNVLLAIPILFILGTPIHFLYDLTGNRTIIGAIVPVNESIFEHFKLATLPLILWWTISYYILKKKIDIDFRKWFFCTSISVLMIPIVIAMFYYTYTGALGISSIVLDIFSLFLALVVGQCLALHLYNNINITNEKFYIGVLIVFLIIICTVVFTFYTPQLPIFKDSLTGTYGIFRLI
mgnify:CR=1 FL=1